MKKNTLKYALFLFSGMSLSSAYGQFTKGGSTKNYDMYRKEIIYDTIKTPIYPPEVKQGYTYFSVGLLNPIDEKFKEIPDGNTSWLDTYKGYDGMGGKLGMSIGFGGFAPFKALNNKIHPIVDIGLGINTNFDLMPFNWKEMKNTSQSVLAIFKEGDYTPFMDYQFSLAPMVALNPLWKQKKNNKLHVDIGYNLGYALVFGGGLRVGRSYSDGFEYTITRDKLSNRFIHGPSFRIRYGALMLGFDVAFLNEYKTSAFKIELETYENYTSNTVTDYIDSRVKLNRFVFSIGVAF